MLYFLHENMHSVTSYTAFPTLILKVLTTLETLYIQFSKEKLENFFLKSFCVENNFILYEKKGR